MSNYTITSTEKHSKIFPKIKKRNGKDESACVRISVISNLITFNTNDTIEFKQTHLGRRSFYKIIYTANYKQSWGEEAGHSTTNIEKVDYKTFNARLAKYIKLD